MRALFLTLWLSLIYVGAALLCGDVLQHAVIAKSISDQRYATSHIEWAMGIFMAVLYVWTRPLFYSWRSLAKKKVVAIIAGSFIWPLYMVLIGTFLFMLPIDWAQLLALWRHPGIWIWLAVSSDPMNILGRWIDESDFWQSHIEMWRSRATLSWLYSAYPPRTPGDVGVGIVGAVGVTLIAPLIYVIRG